MTNKSKSKNTRVVRHMKGTRVVRLLLLALAALGVSAALGLESLSTQENSTGTRPVLDRSSGLVWTGSDSARDMPWEAARRYCEDLTLDGANGWRLPKIQELQRVFDSATAYRCGQFKCGTRLGIVLSAPFVWSSTGDGTGKVALNVFIENGALWVEKSDPGRVLCVRDQAPNPGPPGETPTKEPEGTWLDERAGVLWTERDGGADFNWAEAQKYCRSLIVSGLSGWRLPTRVEFQSLAASSDRAEGLDLVLLSQLQTQKVSYWTSEALTNLNPPESWVYMTFGNFMTHLDQVDSNRYFRHDPKYRNSPRGAAALCVRSVGGSD